VTACSVIGMVSVWPGKRAGDFIELTRGWKQGFCRGFSSAERCRFAAPNR